MIFLIQNANNNISEPLKITKGQKLFQSIAFFFLNLNAVSMAIFPFYQFIKVFSQELLQLSIVYVKTTPLGHSTAMLALSTSVHKNTLLIAIHSLSKTTYFHHTTEVNTSPLNDISMPEISSPIY